MFKGLDTTVKLLEKLNHPRAQECRAIRDKFEAGFTAAFLAQLEKEPRWKDSAGKSHQLLPDFLTDSAPHLYDDAFLLDTGAMVLPWAGLFDAGDPRMIAFENYFRSGPPTLLWGPRSSPISRAILIHELSTCEPCYSWNIVNSWKRGDRGLFLKGLYSLFTGAISTQTYINCEHRNAMYGTVFVAPLMTWLMRQAIIDDQLADGELHLLRLCPLAWVSRSEETVFRNMPTEYGPADVSWQLSEDGATLDVKFAGRWRDKPGAVILYAPPVAGLKSVLLNGKAIPVAETAGGYRLTDY